MLFEESEIELYSNLQIQIINSKVKNSYRAVCDEFGLTNNSHLQSFLLRTFLGFQLTDLTLQSGPIPLVPDILVKPFVEECSANADELNCLYTHKAVKILENLIADRAIRAYQTAIECNCPIIAADIIDRYQNTTLSSQWFSQFCEAHGIGLQNPQSLEEKPQKFCHEAILSRFHDYIANLMHDVPELIYNVDETYCSCNSKGRIVVPEGKNPFVIEEKNLGHITAVCSFNAAGEPLMPFLILPLLQKLPPELSEFWNKCNFASSPLGWMTSSIFLIWAIFFVSEVNKRRRTLMIKIGQKALTTPCLLFLDGHKSRINSLALELFVMNNIKVIVFPAHTSHVIQPFDISVASPLKTALKKAKYNIPKWLEQKLQRMTATAKNRYMMVLSLLDAWSQAATIKNIKSGWEASGIVPFNKERLLSNRFVRKTTNLDLMEPPNTKNTIKINATEITTDMKRIEIARHCYNNGFLMQIPAFPSYNEIYYKIRSGKEKYLSYPKCYFIRINNEGFKSYIL